MKSTTGAALVSVGGLNQDLMSKVPPKRAGMVDRGRRTRNNAPRARRARNKSFHAGRAQYTGHSGRKTFADVCPSSTPGRCGPRRPVPAPSAVTGLAVRNQSRRRRWNATVYFRFGLRGGRFPATRRPSGDPGEIVASGLTGDFAEITLPQCRTTRQSGTHAPHSRATGAAGGSGEGRRGRGSAAERKGARGGEAERRRGGEAECAGRKGFPVTRGDAGGGLGEASGWI